VVGFGFTYETMQLLSDVQLPYKLQTNNNKQKKMNPKHYLRELSILDQNGVSRATIVEMFNVSRSTIYNLFAT
jgi:hypothetical protein